MKKIILIAALVVAANVRANERVHANQDKKEMACAKKCYESIRSLWISGTITLEEAQKLWQDHKKK